MQGNKQKKIMTQELLKNAVSGFRFTETGWAVTTMYTSTMTISNLIQSMFRTKSKSYVCTVISPCIRRSSSMMASLKAIIFKKMVVKPSSTLSTPPRPSTPRTFSRPVCTDMFKKSKKAKKGVDAKHKNIRKGREAFSPCRADLDVPLKRSSAEETAPARKRLWATLWQKVKLETISTRLSSRSHLLLHSFNHANGCGRLRRGFFCFYWASSSHSHLAWPHIIEKDCTPPRWLVSRKNITPSCTPLNLPLNSPVILLRDHPSVDLAFPAHFVLHLRTAVELGYLAPEDHLEMPSVHFAHKLQYVLNVSS